MANPLISIIIPAYNVEKYIRRCLDSVINQTYSNLQIIVIDDGSRDRTASIIDEYAERDQRIIAIHKPNGGVSSARTAGLEKAGGDYIGFVDSDDYIEKEMYEHLIGNALKYDADISHCGYMMLYPDGRKRAFYDTKKLVIQDHKKGLCDLMRGDYIEPGIWNKLYRRSIVLQYKNEEIWDESIRYNEDLLMNYLFFKHSKKSVYEDIAYYNYILRKESATKSNNKSKQLKDVYLVLKAIKKDSASDPELYSIVYERYLRVLINLANKSENNEDSSMAKAVLKREIKENKLMTECHSLKLKLMSFGTAYMFPVYKAVRFIYDKVTKIESKYEV